MLNILVETITRNYMKVTSVMMKNACNKKHTLQVNPYNIWIDHLNHINKNSKGTQPTTHKEDHNNTHTNAAQKQVFTHQGKGKNPRDKDGTVTPCSICESMNHWAPNCQTTKIRKTPTTMKLFCNHPSKLLSLVEESRNVTILNSKAGKTVCRESCFNIFQESLS